MINFTINFKEVKFIHFSHDKKRLIKTFLLVNVNELLNEEEFFESYMLIKQMKI